MDGRFAGHYVWLQRWSPSLARWLSYRKLVLGAHSGRVFPVTYARACTTSLRIPHAAGSGRPGYLNMDGSQAVVGANCSREAGCVQPALSNFCCTAPVHDVPTRPPGNRSSVLVS